MAVRFPLAEDIPLILQILRATPNPPNESEESIALLLENERLVFIDTDAPAICRVVKRRDEEHMDMPWWSWLGTGDMEAKLLPVLGATMAALLQEYGPKAAVWPTSGQLSGFGQTDDERRSDADLRAGALRTMLQRDLPPNAVIQQRALNGKDAYLQTTAGFLAQRAGVDMALLGGELGP